MTAQGQGQGQQQPRPATDQEVELVVAALAAGAALGATAAALGAILAVPGALVSKLLSGLGEDALKPFTAGARGTGAAGARAGGSAVAGVRELNKRYRAAFIINALRRVNAAPPGLRGQALARELGWWKAHIKADVRRRLVARKVDGAGRTWGPELGWYAKMDSRTSAECRAANGRNFQVGHMPVIGYPGMVHPHCRCVPGPPWPGGKPVDDSLTVRRHGGQPGV